MVPYLRPPREFEAEVSFEVGTSWLGAHIKWPISKNRKVTFIYLKV